MEASARVADHRRGVRRLIGAAEASARVADHRRGGRVDLAEERLARLLSPADHVSVCLRRRRFVEGSAPKYKHAGSGETLTCSAVAPFAIAY